MGPNPAPGTPVTGIAAGITDAGQAAAAAEKAISDLSTAVAIAESVYHQAVIEAHHAYLAAMHALHHAPAATPPAPGTPA